MIWSIFKAFCGLAQNFWRLLIARIGLNASEAGGTPPSHSIVAEYFLPSKRVIAMSIYALGVSLGSVIGSSRLANLLIIFETVQSRHPYGGGYGSWPSPDSMALSERLLLARVTKGMGWRAFIASLIQKRKACISTWQSLARGVSFIASGDLERERVCT